MIDAYEYEGPTEGIDSSFQFSCLPTEDPATRIGSSIQTIKRILQREANTTKVTKWVRFSNISPSFLDHNTIFPKSARIFYNKNSRELFVKLASKPHEIVSRSICVMVTTILAGQYGMTYPLLWTGSARVHGTYCAKEPDESLQPKALPAGHSGEWPAVAVEVGVSEGLNRLMNDARWWLANSKGQTKLVIVVSISKTAPQIVYRCVTLLQPSPVLRLGRLRYTTITRQEITQIRAANGSINTTAGSLVVKFDEMFLRPPGPNDADLTFPVSEMNDIAHRVWNSLGV